MMITEIRNRHGSHSLREGDAATIIACGIMVGEALKAADMLEAEGIKVRVLDMATVKPLDAEAVIKAARETGAIVTAEEHNIVEVWAGQWRRSWLKSAQSPWKG